LLRFAACLRQSAWLAQSTPGRRLACRKHLFKLRKTSAAKKMLMSRLAHKDWATPGPSDQGWSAVEDTLKLTG